MARSASTTSASRRSSVPRRWGGSAGKTSGSNRRTGSSRTTTDSARTKNGWTQRSGWTRRKSGWSPKSDWSPKSGWSRRKNGWSPRNGWNRRTSGWSRKIGWSPKNGWSRKIGANRTSGWIRRIDFRPRPGWRTSRSCPLRRGCRSASRPRGALRGPGWPPRPVRRGTGDGARSSARWESLASSDRVMRGAAAAAAARERSIVRRERTDLSKPLRTKLRRADAESAGVTIRADRAVFSAVRNFNSPSVGSPVPSADRMP